MTIWPKIWLILGPNQPQTRLRAQNLTISTQFSRENREEKRGCCREKRKGKQTGCERKTSYSLTRAATTNARRHTHAPATERPSGAGWSPAGVAADDHVRLRHHLPVDGVWHDSGRHRELDGRLEAEYANLGARIRYCAAYSEHGVNTTERKTVNTAECG